MPDPALTDWNDYVRRRLPELHISPARENEIVAELALHIEGAYKDALGHGLTEAAALEQVEARFANWRELAREIEKVEPARIPERRLSLFTGALDDVRHALRFLRKDPSFAAIAIATLAFGIGGNAAMFTMADVLALRGLPYPHPARLMAIETHWSKQSEIEPWTSVPDFFDLREQTRSFSGIAGISPLWNDVMTGRGEAERLDTLYVSSSFFPLLSVQPALGRTFSQSEDNRLKPSNVAVLSDAFWRSHFGANPGAIGQSIVLSGQAITIIGVLPADFRYLGEPLIGSAKDIDVWMPLSDNALIARPRTVRFLKVVGRLQPDVSPESARGEIASLSTALSEKYPDTNRGFTLHVIPLADKVNGRFRTTMLSLLTAIGFIFLMACANVANLLLTRTAAREKDFAVRVALGAPVYRLIRQIVTEASVMALLGGAVGIALAYGGVRLIASAGPASLVKSYPIQIDWRALTFTVITIILSAAVSGLPPAWTLLRERIEGAVRQGSRSLIGGSHRLRSSFVVLEIAVALILLAGAGLLIRSFQRLLDTNPGFDPRNVVTISTQTPQSAATADQRNAIYSLIRERLFSVPGVTSVGAVSRLPLMGSNLGSAVTVEGRVTPHEQGPDVEYRVATPSYFGVMRIPLRRGRMFTDHDDAAAPPVALINESMQKALWPAEDPLGKRIKLGPDAEKQAWITIVGVVGNVHHFGLDTQARPEVYRPYAASPLYAPILVIRTTSNPEPLVSALAAQVRSVNAAIPAYDLYLMQTLVDRSTAQRRFVMWLLTGFALTALLLAGVGVYGIVSQSVAQRTPEIGVRMALGSSPGEALALVFCNGMRLAAIGIALGVAAAAGLTRLMQNLLFGVRPLDPLAFALATIVLAAFAAIACYIPARRATRVDPLDALRQEMGQ